MYETEDVRFIHEKRSRLIAVLNKYSLLFHVLLSCTVCFLIEWVSRHSFHAALTFAATRKLVFLYNSFLVFVSLMLVYLVHRRAVLRCAICAFWLLLGTINGCILLKRVSPFGFTDLKMVGDLFTMQSNYFSAVEAGIAIAAVGLVFVFLVFLWIHGPKFEGHVHHLAGSAAIAVMLLMIPTVTHAAVNSHILAAYFGNLAQGYRDYGFIYSFSASVLDRGMHAPENYSEERIRQIVDLTGIMEGERTEESAPAASLEVTQRGKTTASGTDSEKIKESEAEQPNIICVLLESFVDPEEIKFLELSEDPVPNFRYLWDNYSSGYLRVPVVGAGTANTEFEILTGMSMQFFGLGEYPYKTILKKTNCESIASDLKTLGYGAHVVHNNGGNFYSRRNAFSMMGFDTFTSKEMMDIREYTPLGTWPTDHILLEETEKALDYTPDVQDFVYIITVQGHGEYPQEPVLEDPAIRVTGAETPEDNYAWEYYVNMIHEMDDFIGDLVSMLEQREEKTILVLFGDHLPTMGLAEEDMEAGDLFLTKYVTWNNFGLEQKKTDLTSFQLMAEILDQIDCHTGTIFQYHQNRGALSGEEEYMEGLELLQYDILYGGHYVYGGGNPYPASDLVMGTQDVVIRRITSYGKYVYLVGDNFTKWSKVFVNDEKAGTKYLSSHLLRIAADKLGEGTSSLVVKQMGSSNSVFRESNEFRYTREEDTPST